MKFLYGEKSAIKSDMLRFPEDLKRLSQCANLKPSRNRGRRTSEHSVSQSVSEPGRQAGSQSVGQEVKKVPML